MKQKLTLTIEADLIPRAKRFARTRGVSLSSLVEESLRAVAADEEPTFVARWRGRFRLAERDDERYRSLSEKYG
jgi:DICT domain-containing protein